MRLSSSFMFLGAIGARMAMVSFANGSEDGPNFSAASELETAAGQAGASDNNEAWGNPELSLADALLGVPRGKVAKGSSKPAGWRYSRKRIQSDGMNGLDTKGLQHVRDSQDRKAMITSAVEASSGHCNEIVPAGEQAATLESDRHEDINSAPDISAIAVPRHFAEDTALALSLFPPLSDEQPREVASDQQDQAGEDVDNGTEKPAGKSAEDGVDGTDSLVPAEGRAQDAAKPDEPLIPRQQDIPETPPTSTPSTADILAKLQHEIEANDRCELEIKRLQRNRMRRRDLRHFKHLKNKQTRIRKRTVPGLVRALRQSSSLDRRDHIVIPPISSPDDIVPILIRLFLERQSKKHLKLQVRKLNLSASTRRRTDRVFARLDKRNKRQIKRAFRKYAVLRQKEIVSLEYSPEYAIAAKLDSKREKLYQQVDARDSLRNSSCQVDPHDQLGRVHESVRSDFIRNLIDIDRIRRLVEKQIRYEHGLLKRHVRHKAKKRYRRSSKAKQIQLREEADSELRRYYLRTRGISLVPPPSPSRPSASDIGAIEEAEGVHVRPTRWNKIFYTKAGLECPNHYKLDIKAPSVLDVTELYCPGDAFQVFSNQTFLFETSHVKADGCATHVTAIGDAFSSPLFSSGQTILTKGHYNIRILPSKSPFEGGVAGLRHVPLVYHEPMLSGALGHFTIISTPLSSSIAASACAAFNCELAALDGDNPSTLAEAGWIVRRILSPRQSVWMAACGVSDGKPPVRLFSAESGIRVHTPSTSDRHPALCICGPSET